MSEPTTLSVPADREEEAVAVLRAQAEGAGWVFRDAESSWATSANAPEALLYIGSNTRDDGMALIFVTLELHRRS